MKKPHAIVIGVAVLLIFFVIYHSENIELALKNVPQSVYSKYLEVKNAYKCKYDCFRTIEHCKEENTTKTFFIVSGGYMGGFGDDFYFDENGTQICEAGWSAAECKGGGCADWYKNCPVIKSCETIIKR